MSRKDEIIEKLKQNGCRITRQRKILIDIILENDCASCKEIFYKASQEDRKIGAATVYRMINALEEIGAISRKTCTGSSAGKHAAAKADARSSWRMIRFQDAKEKLDQIVRDGARRCGYLGKGKKISKIIYHNG